MRVLLNGIPSAVGRANVTDARSALVRDDWLNKFITNLVPSTGVNAG